MTNIFKNKIVQATLAILGVGVALGASQDLGIQYTLNGKVKPDFNLAGKQFVSKDTKINIGSIIDDFNPELKIKTGIKEFSIKPVGIEKIKSKDVELTPDGKISYKDKDNDIDYNFYYKEKNKCNSGLGVIVPTCHDSFEQEVVINKYTTSTFYFSINSNFDEIVQNKDGSISFDIVKIDKERNKEFSRITLLKQQPIFFIDANGNRKYATSSIDLLTKIQKIEIDDQWIRNSPKPIIIDPTYVIVGSGLGGTDMTEYGNSKKLVRDSNGILYTVFHLANSSKSYEPDIIMATSSDNGITWSTSSVDNDINGYFYNPAIAIDSNNNLYVSYYDNNPNPGQIYFKKYSNGSWGNRLNISGNSEGSCYAPHVFTDKNNNVYIVWEQYNNSSYSIIRFASSTDGVNFSSTTVSQDLYSNYYATGDVDSNGNIYISYTGGDSSCGLYDCLHFRKRNSNGTWDSEQIVYKKDNENSNCSSLQIFNDNPIIANAVSDGSNYANLIVSYNGSSWSTSTIIGYSTSYYGCPSLSFNKNGTAYVFPQEGGNIYTYAKYNGSSWSTSTFTIDSTNPAYGPNIIGSSYPTFNRPYSGFMGVISIGVSFEDKLFISDDFSWNQSSRPTSTYDANRPTSTWKAYKGGDAIRGYTVGTGMYVGFGGAATSNPFSTNRAEWGIPYNGTGTEFTAAEYGYTSSTNNVYTTTSFPAFMAGSGVPWEFLNSINQFEVYATESPATIKNVSPYFIGNFSNITSTNASATNAMDARMYMENFATGKLVQVASSLNGACTSSCVLTTTTYPWTIANKSQFFKATTTDQGLRWLYRFYVSSAEITTDCLNQSASTTQLLCMKMYETSTGPEGGLSGIGCIPQEDTEDIWSQCTTTAGSIEFGCYTDYCGAGAQRRKCGYYVDNAQHNCPQCYGCRSSDTGEDSCEAKSTWGGDVLNYGCGGGIGGECMSCNNGTCDSTLCVGYQCGCLPGQICDNSGVCQNEAPPTCNDACQGLGYSFGGCYNNIGRCLRMPNGFVDGNSPNCSFPRFCCCHN